MDPEVKALMKALRKQGFDVSGRTADGHPVIRKDGAFVTVLPKTPSDVRWRRNAIAACRPHGFVWPPRR